MVDRIVASCAKAAGCTDTGTTLEPAWWVWVIIALVGVAIIAATVVFARLGR